MFKYLLVPSTGSELDRPAVQMALRAADPSSAHIEFLHVRMDVRRVMVMLAGSGMTLGTGLVDLEAGGARLRAPCPGWLPRVLCGARAQYRSRPEGGYFRKLEHGGRRGIGLAGPAGSGRRRRSRRAKA